jgi:Tol biopolymer transport system component
MPLIASLFSRTTRNPARVRPDPRLEPLEDRRLLSVSVVSVVNNAATLGAGASREPSVSADGRYVAFSSTANNLVTGDANNLSDVFLHDRQTGETILISVGTGGAAGNGASDEPSISADGRFVSFRSTATDLIASDTNGQADIFVRDWQGGTTRRASANSSGPQFTGNANDFSAEPFTSANGDWVAFTSRASNLTSDPNQDRADVPTSNGPSRVIDVFLRDLTTGSVQNATKMVSVNPQGISGNGRSFDPSVSADGRFVAFRSEASDLVTGDTNGKRDILVRNMQTNTTTLVSVGQGGAPANDNSDSPSISQDGRFVVFSSDANNLVPNDTNGKKDVFVHDLQAGTTTLVSFNQLRTASGNGDSFEPTISQDGRFVGFTSGASDLVPGDDNNSTDVFLYDIQSGALTLLSVNQAGRPAQGNSRDTFVAPGGQFIAFSSEAIDLVTGDTNNASDAFLATAPSAANDATAPTATLAATQPAAAIGAATIEFTVTYTDDTALAPVTFGDGDVEVTPPGGAATPATFVRTVGSGKTAQVTYSIPAPGGTVDAADNGAYTVAVRAGTVTDAAGNAVAAGTLGTVTVTAAQPTGPDLVTTIPGTLKPVVGGSKGKATALIQNTGDAAAAGKIGVGLFLSADPLLDPSDVLITTKTLNYKAKPNAKPKKVAFKFVWPSPTGATTGYQLLAQADTTNVIPERNEDNNVGAAAVTVAPPFVDLTGTLAAIPATLAAGQKVKLTLNVANGGNVPALGTATYVVLASADDTASGDDFQLASLPKKLALKPGPKARKVPLTFAVPAGLAAGTYKILVQIGFTGTAPEPNATNNTAVSGTTFTAA